MVVLAFSVPLALLVRGVARDRALTAAERDAAAVVPVLSVSADVGVLASAIARTDAGQARRMTVFLPNGTAVGAPGNVDANVRLARSERRSFSSSVAGGISIVSPVVVADGSTAVVRVLVPAGQLDAGVRRSWIALGGVGVALIAIGVLAADRVARATAAPVERLTEAADKLAGGDLGARVQPGGPPEIVRAGSTFNALADRVLELLAAERELVADLSHRLRTPMTALRLDAEGVADSDQRARVLEDIEGLEDALSALIREAREPLRSGLPAVADAVTVLRERASFWSALADDQGRVWEVDLPSIAMPVRLDRGQLEAAIDVLLDNVFVHTPEGTGLRISATRPPTGAPAIRIVIDDDGPGFANEGVLDRGTSYGGSTGLGLDIAKRTAAACGGSFDVSTRDGGGGRAVLLLPLAD
jgi:signal transduction histidine kinase